MKHKRPGTSLRAAPTLLMKYKEVFPNEKMFNSTLNSNKVSKVLVKPTRKK